MANRTNHNPHHDRALVATRAIALQEFESWTPKDLASALRGMAYEGDPQNTDRKELLLECAMRLIMFDTVSRLGGCEDSQDVYYRRIVKEQGKIQAIKAYRENVAGMTLKAAKEYIDTL